MNKGIFSYLEKDYRYLNNYLVYITDNIFESPHSVIIKGRTFCENLAKEIGKIKNLGLMYDMTQMDRLRTLENKGVLNYKDEIDIAFHTVRKLGNIAAHDQIEGELEAALNIDKQIYKIVCWFIKNYIDYKFIAEPYKDPKPSTGEVAIDPKKIEELMKKTMEDILKQNNDANNDQKNEVVAEDGAQKDIDDAYIGMKIEEIFDDVPDKKCLEQQLSRLKESSKEAVESLGEFTSFKKYMHVMRDAQANFEQLITEASKSQKAELILVCGSVGDGKSHIISYYKNNVQYKEIMDKFDLHNDATESLDPNQTSMDTLNVVLDEFSDEKIETSNKKLILAINLGTLNNFIDSQKYGERFTKLRKYVEDKKILENYIDDSSFDNNSNFQFVNFADYHIFTLKDGKVHSAFIKSLIRKVTQSYEIELHEKNIFFDSYKKNCCNCENKNCCPIKANFELLSEDKVQNSIVDLLVQSIVKNKIIISTRALLNFLYELIVPISYIDVNSPSFKTSIGKMNNQNYIKSLIPNMIFEHKELSFIFDSLYKLDPLNVRNKEVDDFIIDFNNSDDFIKYFNENLEYPAGYLGKLYDLDLSESQDKEKIRYELLKLFIRSFYICGTTNLFNLRDKDYDDYMYALFYWNKGEKAKLRDLYNNVKLGIVKWNGEADKRSINIFLGKNQTKYKVSEKIELKADTSNLSVNDDLDLKKFLGTLTLMFKGDREDKVYKIDVDYQLYKLLIRVTNGYRPNKKDKNQFINFVEFINKLEETGSQNEEIIFTEKNRENNKQFKLEYDEEFETYRFVEI